MTFRPPVTVLPPWLCAAELRELVLLRLCLESLVEQGETARADRIAA